MTRRPSRPSTANTRNGLKWRDGRPRWEPSPVNRACGFKGADLLDHEGRWMTFGQAFDVAALRTLWASVVRAAMQDDPGGLGKPSQARADLRRALDALPPTPADPEARRRRELIADLIDTGRAVLEDREPDAARAVSPRSVQAMIDGFLTDPQAMAAISPATRDAYAKQSRKFVARFGTRPAAEVTRPQIRQWYLDLLDIRSVSTANLAVAAAAAAFRWSMWQDPAWRPDNPATQLGQKSADGRRVFWTPEEEQAFIPWCDANGFEDVADCAVFGLWTAARQVDVCNLDMAEVEGRDSWRFIPQKTRRKKLEALPGLLAPVKARIARRRAALDADRVAHLNAEPFLWDAKHRRRHTSRTIGRRFTEAQTAAVKAGAVPAGFADKHLQDTRDTCVTRLWAAGVKLERIATWGGWSINTAGDILRKHYLTLLEDGALESAQQLEAWAVKNGLILNAA